MARVSLHKYLSLDETLNIFAGLGLFKILQKKKKKKGPTIFYLSSRILDQSSKVEPHSLFLQSAGLEP